MQMSNGWSFTFGGNVNAFVVYEKQSDVAIPSAPIGGIVGAGGEGATRIRTGLLPAFAVFDARGKRATPISACTSGLRRRFSAAPPTAWPDSCTTASGPR